jgi:DedD protein
VVEPKKTVEVKPTTVEITKEFSQEPSAVAEKEAKLVAQKKALAKKIAKEKEAAQAKKVLEEKRLAEVKAKQEAQAKKELQMKKETTVKNGYFIQVGSFTQTPSARFLSVIKNSGFSYKITPASSTGTKKLLIGPYASRAEVDTALVRVRDRINKSAFVVKK